MTNTARKRREIPMQRSWNICLHCLNRLHLSLTTLEQSGKIMIRCPLHVNFTLFRVACIIQSQSWYCRKPLWLWVAGCLICVGLETVGLSVSKPLGKLSFKMSGITRAKKETVPVSLQDSESPQKPSYYGGFWSQGRPRCGGSVDIIRLVLCPLEILERMSISAATLPRLISCSCCYNHNVSCQQLGWRLSFPWYS